MSFVCRLCGGSERDLLVIDADYRVVRCRACRLIALENPPEPAELAHFYSFASGYGLESRDDRGAIDHLRRLAQRHLRQLDEALSQRGRLVDVGCAAGFFLAEARKAGWDVAGVELNPDSAGLARDRFGVDVHVGTLKGANLEESSLDAVTMWDVIEHAPDPTALLLEARRVLRPGGALAISTPNADGLFPRLSLPIGRRIAYWPHAEPPAHLFQFTTATLSRSLTSAGFEIVETIHERTPLKYTLARGGFRRLLRSPRRIAFALAFLPVLVLGPWLRSGDEIVVIAHAR